MLMPKPCSGDFKHILYQLNNTRLILYNCTVVRAYSLKSGFVHVSFVHFIWYCYSIGMKMKLEKKQQLNLNLPGCETNCKETVNI